MLLFALLSFPAASSDIWPSPRLDAFEYARFDQIGHNSPEIATLILPCTFFLFGSNATGRSDAADWIRTAYHDMATHNITDGTGGLDASIRFAEEQARPENTGDGFRNSLDIFLNQATRYISIADAIAVGADIAIENCGGPEIAFRGGRADAGEPNAPGVPQPQEELETHITDFARQGFTQTEMIGLVACALEFFPLNFDLDDPGDTDDVAHFDTTFVTFDNNVATEYLSGTTQNPLVVGFNDTTNSDKRISSSDGNVTIASFAKSLELYTSTYAELFARMLDTVPRSVHLTDVITPLPVKPNNVQLILVNDTIQFSGEVRFCNMTRDDTRTVNLLWDDHIGGTHNVSLGFAGTSTSTAGKYSAAWYVFNATQEIPFLSLDPAAGITNMRFVVDGRLDDQGGVGFAVQDSFMFSDTSCGTMIDPNFGFATAAQVRNGVKPTRLYLEALNRDNV